MNHSLSGRFIKRQSGLLNSVYCRAFVNLPIANDNAALLESTRVARRKTKITSHLERFNPFLHHCHPLVYLVYVIEARVDVKPRNDHHRRGAFYLIDGAQNPASGYESRRMSFDASGVQVLRVLYM